MRFCEGFKCRNCGAIYPKVNKYNLPKNCTDCYARLIQERQGYSFAPFTGEKTYDTNLFGGYDCFEATTTENAIPVLLGKKHLFSRWRILKEDFDSEAYGGLDQAVEKIQHENLSFF